MRRARRRQSHPENRARMIRTLGTVRSAKGREAITLRLNQHSENSKRSESSETWLRTTRHVGPRGCPRTGSPQALTCRAELLASRPDASDPIWITPDMAPTALLGALNVSRVHSIRIETRYGDDRYQIRAEVPGIDPKDIDVDVKDGLLHIQARRYSEQDDVEDDVEWTGRRSEFAYGTFTRVVPLPEGADEDDIQADYRLGVLTITVGISGSIPSPRRIEIRSSESRSPRRMP